MSVSNNKECLSELFMDGASDCSENCDVDDDDSIIIPLGKCNIIVNRADDRRVTWNGY